MMVGVIARLDLTFLHLFFSITSFIQTVFKDKGKIMSGRIFLQETLLVLFIILSSSTEDSHAKFSLIGSANEDPNGFTRLTNTKKHVYGQAFGEQPFTFKNSSSNGTATSFTVNFFFAIAPEKEQHGSHGMAFVLSPTKGIPKAFPDQYLGLFNVTNNGNSSNHVIAVEIDTHKDDEFGDIDDNHVGININGLRSVKSASAGYYDKDGNFKNLSLISKTLMRLSVVYSQPKKQLNVTLSPVEMATQSKKPLLSLNQDLSPFLLDQMYVGFTASTGSVGAIHYIWDWHIDPGFEYHPSLELNLIPVVPPYPRKISETTKKVLVVCLTVSVFVALVASAFGLFFYLRHKKVKDVLEEWEIQFGPHRFEYKELFKATKGFKDRQLVGKGGFGQVYRGNLPGSGAEIAVKRISHNSRQGMREFLAEISTIGRLRHRNLVRLLGYCRHQAELFLIYDFMPNGSLDRFLYQQPEGQELLTWDQRFKIIKDIASALLYLHHQWAQVVVHRDIKPENVLIDVEWNARLGDFGLAKLYEQGYDPETTKVAGTFGYMAPELVITGRANTSTDVYAFGLLMLEIACGRRPLKPRAAPEEVVLVEWIVNCWEKEDIMMVVDERVIGEERNREELELVLKLGLLCAHRVAAARPAMTTVMRILNGLTQLPNNLLDIVKVGRYEGLSDTSEEVLPLVNLQNSFCTSILTEPFTSRGR